MAYFGYSPSSGPPVSVSSLPPPTFNNNQLGSPNSSSGAGGMSGSTSPTGITTSSPATTCCDGGRPLVTDPVTGQSVCSCSYDPSRLTLSSYPRLNPYGSSPYAPPSDQNPYPTLESAAFYPTLGGAYGLKEGSASGGDVWPNHGALPNGYYNPYDPTFAAAYGYGGSYDLAARRKNATRESTATLKAWLSEHKKNPYPTKGEKIMLAIITKMTLTQVSTWFANARRRLKKENKMTWSPKTSKNEDDDDEVIDDEDDSSSAASPPVRNNNNIGIKIDPSNDPSKSDCAATSKPKIWSLADTATSCKSPPPPPHMLGHPHYSSHNHVHPMSHHGGPPPPPVSSSWSFPLPAYRYGGFLPPVSGDGVASDTPPQTPPNLKLLGIGNQSSSSHHELGAFKPVLKSSSGGFCM